MEKVKVITHRGLDPSKQHYFVESSLEAFCDQLNRGYGLEFDLQPAADGSIVIIHDSNLKRISSGSDTRQIRQVNADEILAMRFAGCRLTTLPALLSEIVKKQTKGQVSALHLKHSAQDKVLLDHTLSHLKEARLEQLIVFDVELDTARFLKKQLLGLRLAPSVAHPYDIKRFNEVVGGTLMSVEEAIANRDLFDWVWLDEWDLDDEKGKKKSLYNEQVFRTLREAGLKIAVVSPELHGSSPGLLGGEAHPDAQTHDRLMKRIEEIITMKPDAICTDYPDEVRALAEKEFFSK